MENSNNGTIIKCLNTLLSFSRIMILRKKSISKIIRNTVQLIYLHYKVTHTRNKYFTLVMTSSARTSVIKLYVPCIWHIINQSRQLRDRECAGATILCQIYCIWVQSCQSPATSVAQTFLYFTSEYFTFHVRMRRVGCVRVRAVDFEYATWF